MEKSCPWAAAAIREEAIDEAARATGKRLAIMADLAGPKMRIGQFKEEPVDLEQGDALALTADDIVGDRGQASVSFKRLPQVVRRGDALHLNDGVIQLEVLSVTGKDFACKVVVGGELRSRKGINLPGIDLGIGAFTERDHECLKFAAQEGMAELRATLATAGIRLHEGEAPRRPEAAGAKGNVRAGHPCHCHVLRGLHTPLDRRGKLAGRPAGEHPEPAKCRGGRSCVKK